MQTFLPDPSFRISALMLDNQRLGKQRVETLQIMNSLLGIKPGWRNHPAVKMWRGHEHHLWLYGIQVCLEWRRRGFKDTCLDKMNDLAQRYAEECGLASPPPPWLGDWRLHFSHQSNLIRKRPDHYGPLFPTTPDDLPYFWPV